MRSRFVVYVQMLCLGLGIFGPVFGIVAEERAKNISVDSFTEFFPKVTAQQATRSYTKGNVATKKYISTPCGAFSVLYQEGVASWYGPGFHGRPMANGKPYDMHAYTVAHRKLPLGTRICVINPENDKRVFAIVTDRGPYIDGRIVDHSKKIADELGITERGIASVTILR